MTREEKIALAREAMSRDQKEELARKAMEQEVLQMPEVQTPESRSMFEGAGNLLQDMLVSGAQGPTLSLSDEIYGALSAPGQKIANPDVPISDLYAQERDVVRGLQEQAKTRSPIASFGSELAASVATPGALGKVGAKIPGALKALFAPQSLGQAAASGAVQMAGASSTDISEDPMAAAVEVAAGAGLGGASKYVGDVVGGLFKKPANIRASALGATKKDFKIKGPQNRLTMVKTLTPLNFYGQGPMEYSLAAKKFVPAKPGTLMGDGLADTYMMRSLDAIDKISDNSRQLIAGVQVPARDVMRAMNDAITQAEIGSDLPKSSLIKAQDYISQWAQENLSKYAGQGSIPAAELEALKRNLQETASAKYSKIGQTDVAIAEKSETIMALANRLRKVLENTIPSTEYANNNKVVSALYTQKKDLENLIAKEAAKSGSGKVGFGNVMEAITSPLSSTEATMKRANVGDLLNQFSNTARIMGVTAQQAPQKVFTSSMMGGAPIPEQGTEPQNYMTPQRKAYDVTRAKSLIDSKLLPDSGFLLNNKDLFLQKLAIQRSPQEADDMRALLDRTTSQKALKTMLAQFAYKNPDMFQFDDENRFDGIIQQDVDVAKAKNDIMRSKMGSREKARLIDALKNRQEGVSWPK